MLLHDVFPHIVNDFPKKRKPS